MLTFEEYQYERPVIDELKSKFDALLTEFKDANSYEQQDEIITKINELGSDFSTQMNLAYIRASIDTNDVFYQGERDYLDEISPEYQELETAYYKELVSTPFRSKLEEKWGTQLFAIADNAIKSFSPEVVPLLQKENKLSSAYSKLCCFRAN